MWELETVGNLSNRTTANYDIGLLSLVANLKKERQIPTMEKNLTTGVERSKIGLDWDLRDVAVKLPK